MAVIRTICEIEARIPLWDLEPAMGNLKNNEENEVFQCLYWGGIRINSFDMFRLFILIHLLIMGINFGLAQSAGQINPPNIVLFVADDLGVRDIGPYGNVIVQTPHLDELARESLLFNQAFAASPTCAPSRAALLTGQMPFRNGAHANHTGIKKGIRTLPSYLKLLGYQTAIAGKYHIGPSAAYPFELIHGTNVPEQGYEGKGVLWTDLNMEPVEKWLKTAAQSDSAFFLMVNDHSPHVIWPEKPEYDSRMVDIPPIHIDTDETRHARARYYTDISKMDRNLGRLLDALAVHNLSDNTIVIFTADQGPQWAFGKWNLYDYGIQVPLIIRWPGMVLGGTVNNALVSLVDILPSLVEIAGGKASEYPFDGKSLLPLLQGKSSSHRDEVFGSHTGDGTMNQSPMRMIRTHRYKYILNLAPKIPYVTHIDKATDHDGGREYWSSWVEKSYQSQQAASVLWRYHNRPNEELYDVMRDPWETRNLAFDPHFKEILEGFRQKMVAWRTQQNDQESGPYQSPQRKPGKPMVPYIFR